MDFIKYSIITAVFFLLLDSLWLGVLAKEMYQNRLGSVINLSFSFRPAFFFYAIYVCGIVYFAVQPALAVGSWQKALVQGVLLGGLCYATYDLTNMATIKDWPLFVVIADIIWGMIVTGGSAVGAFLIIQKFGL